MALLVTGAVVLRTRKGRRQDLGEGKTKEKPPPPPPPPKIEPTPSSTQAPPDVPCCGPEVADNVLGCMIKMMNDFFAWNPDRQETYLGYLTRIPKPTDLADNTPNFNNAWDIAELAPPDRDDGGTGYVATLRPYEKGCMKPRYPCYPSVMFLGYCHNPQVVNYVMWGVLARLREWKDKGPAKTYGDTHFSDLHNDRSGYGAMAQHRQIMDDGLPPPSQPLASAPYDPNYPDQVAMSESGWRLADDYIARKQNGKMPYRLADVNTTALKAILQIRQSPSRIMADCQNCCGKYKGTNTFRYIWGTTPSFPVPLSKL